MMKSNRTTIVLLVLFFGGLLAMWGLDLSGVRTAVGSRARVALRPARPARHARGGDPPGGDRPGRRAPGVRPPRQGPGPLADAPAQGCRGRARRSSRPWCATSRSCARTPDARTIESGAETYGLTPPAAIVRLYAGPGGGSASSEPPVAELEIGKVVHDRRYVRPVGGAGIEVVNARLLAAVNRPAGRVARAERHGRAQLPGRSVKITGATRPGRRRWSSGPSGARPGAGSSRAPIDAPANGPKVESLLGALASLRVAEPPKGYVADDVRDLARFGLAEPPVTIELTTMPDVGTLALDVGKPVPDEPERVYVRQGGQDDVVMVEARALSEVPADATALRSREVADIVPAAVTEIEIRTRSDVFDLKKERGGWELTSPHKERADGPAVQQFLAHIDELPDERVPRAAEGPRRHARPAGDVDPDPAGRREALREPVGRRPRAWRSTCGWAGTTS